MQGEAEVVRRGQHGLIKMGLAKKLEGNPQHPVNHGKLCARGQAGLQVLYHPDRITHPIKRTGPRGSGEFQQITWDDALKEVAAHLTTLQASKSTNSLAFLARPLIGQRQELIARFLKAYGAPPAVWYEPFDEAVLRQANLLSFGHAALPTFDLARADYVISFGADFLGTWNSPVAQSAGYGEMRQGRPGRRAKFVQVEARMSQTGANADEWVACRPGTEGALALGIAHVILSEKLVSQSAGARAGSLIAGWSAGLPEFAPEVVEKQTGVSAAVIKRLAHEITQSGSAAAIIGGAPLAHTNGLFNALAVNALESLVDTVGRASGLDHGLHARAGAGRCRGAHAGRACQPQRLGAICSVWPRPQMLLLYEANPIFSAPPALRIREAMAQNSLHRQLRQLHRRNQRPGRLDPAGPCTARELARQHSRVGLACSRWPVSRRLPCCRCTTRGRCPMCCLAWRTSLAVTWPRLFPGRPTMPCCGPRLFRCARAAARSTQRPTTTSGMRRRRKAAGGACPAHSANASPAAVAPKAAPMAASAPEFAGAAADFPFYFLPYVSQSLGDGSLAHLPWLQELPDVLTSAMWSSWVEINPKTGERLGIQQGDLVEIASQQGSVRAAAVLSPGIAPDMVAMPVGQGHENFGRFASGRGANPLSILAPLAEHETGSLAWAATRVKLARVGGPEQARLVLFAGGMSGFPHEEERR